MRERGKEREREGVRRRDDARECFEQMRSLSTFV